MKASLVMTKEFLENIMQIDHANLKLTEVVDDGEFIRMTVETDNPEFDDKQLMLTYTSCDPIIEIESIELMGEPIVKQCFTRLHTITPVQ